MILEQHTHFVADCGERRKLDLDQAIPGNYIDAIIS